MMPLPIGALSKHTGVKVPTIRYYESVGLLPSPVRTESNRRVYGPEAVKQLRFIKHARNLGFEIGAIRELISLTGQPNRHCDQADGIAREHLAEIDQKIAQLRGLGPKCSEWSSNAPAEGCKNVG